jgi:prevent-host-death family protein
MPRIQLSEDIKPLSEFRSNARSYIDKVRKTKRPLVVTQRGKSAAVILDVEEYESMLNKIEILQDIQLADKQIKEGKGVEHEDAKKQVLKNIKQ